MENTAKERNPYLDELEINNPGYIARDMGKEVVLDPLSRVSEREQLEYMRRAQRLGIETSARVVAL